MYSIFFFCTLFLVTPSWAALDFPTSIDFFQDLVDMFNGKDTLYDGFYDFGGTKMRIRFYHDVTLNKDNCKVEYENSTLKYVKLTFNIPLTRFDSGDQTPVIAEWTDCLVNVDFTLSFPTADEMDIAPSQVVYQSCGNGVYSPDNLVTMTTTLTDHAKTILSRHYDNAQEIRFKIMQHRLEKFLYWA